MKILRAFRTELDPTSAQRRALLRHAGAARWAYNWGLERKIVSYRQTGRAPDAMELHRELNELKVSRYSWLYELSKCAPQEALRDLDRAFRNYSRARGKGKRWGFPRFKSRKRGIVSFRLTGKIKVETHRIRLPRLGWMRLKEAGYIPSGGVRLLSVSVGERAGRWFVSVRVEQDIEVSQSRGPVVGVDVGILKWATTSDGTVYEVPPALGRLERRLERAQHQLSRKQRGSRNRARAARRVARLYERISALRRDALHKITTQLTRANSVIVIEDLSVASMKKNRLLARAISARTWGSFRQMLEYKAQWYGCEVRLAPALFPSTRRCSCVGCGCVQERLELSQRTFVCSACGCSRDRDLNAALNLRGLAVSSTDTRNACGGDVGPSIGRRSPSKQESVKPLWVDAEERSMASTTAYSPITSPLEENSP